MRPLFTFAAVLLIVTACVSISPNTELVGVINSILPTVVQINTLDKYGSGVLIRDNDQTYVLTCHHLFEENPHQPLCIIMQDETKYSAVHEYSNRAYDLAILRVPNLPKNHCTMEISYDPLKIGEALIILGYPARCGFSISSGVVSGINKEATMRDRLYGGSRYFNGLVQTDAPINPGNSGGPVINTAGRLIGIAQLTNMSYDGIGMFISIPKIREFLDGKDYQGLDLDLFRERYRLSEP
jgi:S1-C subfamily serine protease